MLGAALSIVGATATVIAPTAAGAFVVPSSVTLTGHGWGHGHGMGQWGALGYALAGTPYQSIVAHYYTPASPASLTIPQEITQVRVDLTENDGNSAIVTSGSAFSVNGVGFAAGGAAQLFPLGGGQWAVSRGGSCGGPWSPVATMADPTAAPAHDPALGDPDTAVEALQLCQAAGTLPVRGDIEATYNSDGAARTVNIVPLEEYVAGVVPNESPASWGTLGAAGPQGEPWGFQELEAQAIAARSYVMAGLGSY